jgi:hypothetical protein
LSSSKNIDGAPLLHTAARTFPKETPMLTMSGTFDREDQATINLCAQAGHELNRVFSIALGDKTHPTWDLAPEWHKQSNRTQALYALRGASEREAHELWRADKVAAGWTYGERRDPEKKQHPALLPYGDLPPEQQAKNLLFRSAVMALSAALAKAPR